MGDLHHDFKGVHQHDCQEFLGIFLDFLNEDLKRFNPQASLKSNTSMELNMSSVGGTGDKECWHPIEAGDCSGEKILMKKSSSSASASAVETSSANNPDLNKDEESRESESASPKSFDSHSSLGKAKNALSLNGSNPEPFYRRQSFRRHPSLADPL